jgi:hypothetical protein
LTAEPVTETALTAKPATETALTAAAESLLLSVAATGNVTLATLAGGGGGTTVDANSTGLGLECFTFSGVEAGGRDGEDAAYSVAFGFLAFSGVEAVAKGAAC